MSYVAIIGKKFYYIFSFDNNFMKVTRQASLPQISGISMKILKRNTKE